MKTLLNVIWLVLAGFWLALGYLLAAVRARELNVGMAAADSTIAVPD